MAVEIIEALLKIGFNFDLVLADSLYGESPTFIAVLSKHKKHYLLAIRSNFGMEVHFEQFKINYSTIYILESNQTLVSRFC
ncbi:hypothetical protein [Nostoc sp.]|uniref:hypothetical protein n=1 Tax=Nostoc sp. TaxID=1180 RepID=UPI003FA5C5F1